MAAAALIPVVEHAHVGELIPIDETTRRAQDFMVSAKAPSTIRAYRRDFQHFRAWCQARGLQPLPAAKETVALYLADLARDHKASTIQRRASAIAELHKLADLEPPTRCAVVVTCLAGIRRQLGTAPDAKDPVLIEDLRAMVAELPAGLLGVRDRALLLLGFAGAFRRSEIVALNVEDLDFRADGLVVLLRRSKTDQEGEGRKVGLPYGSNPETCPVRAVRAWLEAAGISTGPVFHAVNRHGQVRPRRLTDQTVALAVKRYAGAAGKDARKFAGHSLRAGLATSAAIAGVPERIIMKQTGHKSVNMVHRYIRDASLFRENAAARVGL